MGLIYSGETRLDLKGAIPVKLPLILYGQEQIICRVDCPQAKKTWLASGKLEQFAFFPEAGMVTIASFQMPFSEDKLLDLRIVESSYLRFVPVKWLVYRTNITISTIDMPLYSIPLSGQPPSTSGRQATVSLPTANTVVPLVTADVDRDALILQNIGSRTVFIGFSNTVSTTSYAFSIASGQAYEFPTAYTGALWAVSGTASQSINVVEML
jgi:hypothetical protein